MSDPREEKNVEELLSQLEGIFGKLSKTDEEDARPKTDLPVKKSEPSAPSIPAPEPIPQPLAEPTPPLPVIEVTVGPPAAEPARLTGSPLEPEPPFREDPFSLDPPPSAPLPVDPPPPPLPRLQVEVASTPVMAIPETPHIYDASTVGCAIFYPLMKEKEAQILSQKVETMTPKFTKLAFKLKVGFILSYDPRSDWREAAVARVRENNIRAFFLLSDRVLEETKRRSLQSELESHLIYFQEVPTLSLEKKAFFTDVLLGMVFFFDTLKPKSSGE